MAERKGQWIRTAKRLAIYHRDGFACLYCGKAVEDGAVLSLDHVLAHDLGGSNSESNLVTACISCNSSKQALSTRAWFTVLRDRGIGTTTLSARIRKHTSHTLNMAHGHTLLANRKGL